MCAREKEVVRVRKREKGKTGKFAASIRCHLFCAFLGATQLVSSISTWPMPKCYFPRLNADSCSSLKP